METVPFSAIHSADLQVDAVYQGGRMGNAGDDPLPQLQNVSNSGGFRYRGSLDALELVVLTSSSTQLICIGYVGVSDAGKKIKGRKRHIVTDTLGLLVGIIVHGANIQDRDGAPLVLASIRQGFPWLRHIFADGGYAGPKLRGALGKIGDWTIEIVKRSDTAKGFQVIPRRRVVERTFAWLGRCRPLAKDFEKTIASAQAWITISQIRLVTRRLARYCYET